MNTSYNFPHFIPTPITMSDHGSDNQVESISTDSLGETQFSNINLNQIASNDNTPPILTPTPLLVLIPSTPPPASAPTCARCKQPIRSNQKWSRDNHQALISVWLNSTLASERGTSQVVNSFWSQLAKKVCKKHRSNHERQYTKKL